MATVEITAAQIDHASSDPLSRHDYAILNEVEGSLARGLQLKAWWDQTKAGGPGAKRFPTALTFNHPDFSFAFFGHAGRWSNAAGAWRLSRPLLRPSQITFRLDPSSGRLATSSNSGIRVAVFRPHQFLGSAKSF